MLRFKYNKQNIFFVILIFSILSCTEKKDIQYTWSSQNDLEIGFYDNNICSFSVSLNKIFFRYDFAKESLIYFYDLDFQDTLITDYKLIDNKFILNIGDLFCKNKQNPISINFTKKNKNKLKLIDDEYGLYHFLNTRNSVADIELVGLWKSIDEENSVYIEKYKGEMFYTSTEYGRSRMKFIGDNTFVLYNSFNFNQLPTLSCKNYSSVDKINTLLLLEILKQDNQFYLYDYFINENADSLTLKYHLNKNSIYEFQLVR